MESRTILLGLLSTICCTTVFWAQEVTSTKKKDSVLFVQLIDSARYHFTRDLNVADDFITKAIALANKKNMPYNMAVGLMSKSAVLARKDGEANLKEAQALVKQSLSYFRATTDSLQVFRCLTNLTTISSLLHQYDTSLNFALKAKNLSNTLLANGFDDNYTLKESLYGQTSYLLGVSYRNLGMIDSAIGNFESAAKAYKLVRSYKEFASLSAVGHMQLQKKDFQEALRCFTEANQGYTKLNNLMGIISTDIGLGDAFLELNAFPKAKAFYIKALKMSGANGYVSKNIRCHLNLAELYFLQHTVDSALFYIEKGVQLSKSNNATVQIPDFLNLKIKIAEKQGNFALALEYSNRAKVLSDSIKALENLPKTTEVLLSAKEEERKNTVEEYQSKLNLSAKSLWAVLIISCVLIASLLCLYRWNRLKNQQVQGSLLEDLNVSRNTNENLHRSMTSINANLAIKNDLLAQTGHTLKEIVEFYEVSPAVEKQLNATQEQLQENMVLSKLWQDFFTHFEGVHPDFTKKLLENHSLSTTHLRICCFLRMGLDYKEIGNILNIQQESVRKSVYRIRKKLQLKEETTIYDFLHTI